MSKNVVLSVALFWIAKYAKAWVLAPHPWAPRFDTVLMTRSTSSRASVGTNYVETPAGERLRHFWENQTFDVTERILDAAICRNSSVVHAPLLVRHNESSAGPLLDLFSPLFETLYDISSNDTLRVSNTQHNTRRSNFRLVLAYRGSHFCGFQSQHDNPIPSVQESLEKWLQGLGSTSDSTCISGVNIVVSGRTDAGVHALGQTCRFRTKQQVTAEQVLQHLEAFPLVRQGSLRCLKVTREPDSFHPTFQCTKRAYAYLMDPENMTTNQVNRLDSMLQRIEGQELDYVGVSYGRVKTETTLCTIEHCRASLVTLSMTNEPALCIEIVGDRFLRRMVRIIVATALRQAIAGLENEGDENDENALLDLIRKQDRKLAARSAPPSGLIFVGAEVD